MFGHDEPYEGQAEGIETAVGTARDGGFLVLEGACGTGKTMLALTAGIHLVRDGDSKYDRVVVLTSVKQQLRQFEADLRTINANLPDDWAPVTGLTLVGKADVCPYNRAGAGGIDDENVYERCESLRDRTRELTGEDGSTTAGALASEARSQQVGLLDTGSGGPTTGTADGPSTSGSAGAGAGDGTASGSTAGGNSGPAAGGDAAGTAAAASYLEAAGEMAPYAPDMPEVDDTEYCPFYAQYLDDLPEDGDPAEAVPFDLTDVGLVEPDDLVAMSVEYGTCPHSMMGALQAHAEVVVGNYYHAFDPTTVASFTGALLDDSTFVVCDEAHMLEPRVRDLVSDAVGDATLRTAVTELNRVLSPLEADESPGEATSGADAVTPDLVRGELADTDISRSEIEVTREFVRDLREELDRRVTAYLDREHEGWRADLTELSDEEIPLRDPERPAPDEITKWAADAGYDGGVWVRAEAVGAIVARILNEADDEEATRAAPAVGRVLGAWYREDHQRYFREITLDRTWDDTEPSDSWRRAYNARLAMQNCVPSDAIGNQLAEFGGGVLMSATLEPLDVLTEVTGLNHLESEGRPVAQRRQGLNFPAENRESFAVAAPKFTHDNRGPPGGDSAVRAVYADAIAEVARSPGNVLVGMPSYGEAEWAARVLRDRVDKEVLIDESSADDVTEALKERFFAGDPKVLVTSLRGTLTEGVDYEGDKLRAAVVCGVPIINTASARTRAVRTAYDDAFGDGFRYALSVPAVRKARQALGRVIRGPEEVGVRVLVDERYARESWDSVRDLLPPAERAEFQPVSPDMVGLGLERFWDGVDVDEG